MLQFHLYNPRNHTAHSTSMVFHPITENLCTPSVAGTQQAPNLLPTLLSNLKADSNPGENVPVSPGH